MLAGPEKETALLMDPASGVKVAEGTEGFTVRLLAEDVPQLLAAVTEITPL
jgi:hypothetical protein